MRSERPFPATFTGLREIRGLSERQVSAAAARHGAPGHSGLHRVYNGEKPPLPQHMRAIAAALGIDPDTFVEYRLWKVRRLFDIVGDPRRDMEPIPFETALHNLHRFEELTAEAGRPASAMDPSEIAAGLRDPESDDPARGERA
jgi:transcriptional regulator with XRE-family HTH domain